jgi:hypothetical protein
MTTQTSLPARPSLESLRRQAKQLVRGVAAGNAAALARVRAQLPDHAPPLSRRDAQLVIAREHGFPGWRDLIREVYNRLGQGLEWAAIEAGRAIRNDDAERLERLLKEFPALSSWRNDFGASLLSLTHPFRDSFEAEVEKVETRPACAEKLLDAGAGVDQREWRGILSSRARGMLRLYWERGALPRTLLIVSALGDLDGVRSCIEKGETPAAIDQAFLSACRFKNDAVASFLLDKCIEHDGRLRKRIDGWQGRAAFIAYLGEHPHAPGAETAAPWQVLVTGRLFELLRTDDEPSSFARFVQSEPWLLDDEHVAIQVAMFENFSFRNREGFIRELLALNPALLRRRPPPEATAILMAIDYGNAHLVPLLTPIWPLPDDLPHAAGMGDFANVKKWFDPSGRPRLSDPSRHHPGSHPETRSKLHWGPPNAQQVLDVALAWAVMNRQFEIAAFLLEHGADIDTRWCTHEPASILHELVFQGDYEQIQFVIDHGIDLTIRDYRWNATAQGWASVAKQDEELARFLADAERDRKHELG